MFNPFSNLVYDYMGGMEDIKKAKVCMYLLTFICLIGFARCGLPSYAYQCTFYIRFELWFLHIHLSRKIAVRVYFMGFLIQKDSFISTNFSWGFYNLHSSYSSCN